MKKKYIRLICVGMLLVSAPYSGFAQQQLIKGTITDEAGKPISFAIVSIKEQPGVEVISDSTGNFAINGQIGQRIEITSGRRYKTYRIKNNPVALSITDNDVLIPLGFGMFRDKEEVTSAIGMVGYDKLSQSLAINPADALYGKIPGLAVMQSGGAPWENDPTLYIRGIGTMRGASILVLVDGFERPISSLSLGEIESVVILKDAAALAMYGQRGANGVLLVTTKQADAEKPSISVEYEHGITQATRLPKFLDAYDYANSVNEALTNDGLDPLYSQAALDSYKSGNNPVLFPNVNWFNEVLRNSGTIDNFKATFQRKAKNISFFTLLNYEETKGLLGPVNKNKGYSSQLDYSKFNFRSKIDINLTKTTKFLVNVGGNLRGTQTPGTGSTAEGTAVGSIMSALYNTPSAAYAVKNPDNTWGGTSFFDNNPYAQISATGYRKTFTRELLTDFHLEQKLDLILPGLSAEVAIAYDNSAIYLEGKTREFEYEAQSVAGDGSTVKTLYGSNTTLTYYNSLGNQWSNATARGALKYVKEWGKNSINSTLLYQQDKLSRTGKSNTFLHRLAAANVHYSRDMKYFADLAVSYSGTNLLPRDNRWGLFPAISLGWKMSNENWFSKGGLVDDLKIRASWGMTGNDQLIPPDIADEKFIGATGYYFTNNTTGNGGLAQGQIATSGPTFETSAKTNFGIDASMFGMLDLNVDVFYDHRTDILVTSENLISDVYGAIKPYRNYGVVNNKGIDFGINFHNKKGEITYYINGQLSYVKNTIVEMGEQFYPNDYLKRTGKSIDQAFGLEAIGFFKDAADIAASPQQLFSEVKPGDIKYKDQNGNKLIDIYDEKALGYSTRNPEIYYSGSFGLEYRGFGINALFQGVANKSLYLNTPSLFWPLRGNSNISEFSNDRWTAATAATATQPRLTTKEDLNNYRPNSIWIVDGSFLKLRTVEVYFDLPSQLISKWKISNTRVFFRGMNLFSIDNINIVDPEAIGITYPICSSYSIGAKIGF